MARQIFDASKIHHAVADKIGADDGIIAEVQSAIAAHDVVVVGMKQNPNPGRARRALEAKGVPFHYLEYGSYFGVWRRRLVLKMWTGWPTFPMVFVKGVLVGGADDVIKLIDSGELERILKKG